jgi:predicted amidohydrolase
MNRGESLRSTLFVLIFGIAACSPLRADERASENRVGRPVRVVSLSFRGQSMRDVLGVVDAEGARGADLIVLPETWRGQNDHTRESLEGPTIRELRNLAQKYNTYIVSPIDRIAGDERLNSAVLLDRKGQVAGVYDKVYPYWSELDHAQPVKVAKDIPVFDTDFGRLGIAICFDVNFPELWQELADRGAELVVWPSAYSAGASLQAHALNHHYYVVSSTHLGDCQVFDITGEKILDERGSGIHVSRITLDLDRGIYHDNFNGERRDNLLRERHEEVELEKTLDREQWFILRSKRPGSSARKLAELYGLEELRDYISRSRRELAKHRSRATSPLAHD